MPEDNLKKTNTKLYLGVALICFFVFFVLIKFTKPQIENVLNLNPSSQTPSKIEKFKSEQEFKSYVLEGQQINQQEGIANPAFGRESLSFDMGAKLEAPQAFGGGGAQRVSETNVQVAGIDEPDIVKTDGKNLFLSQDNYYYYARPEPFIMEDKILPPDSYQGQVRIVNAFPPENLKVASSITKNGQLLLSNNILMVFENNIVTGFDVAGPQNPKEVWKLELDQNYIITSRLMEGTVYLVAQSQLNIGNPCPIPLARQNGVAITVPCTDIFHPFSPISVDSTYTIMAINPANGEVKSRSSFVGTSGSSVIYMSSKSIYLTYTIPGDYLTFFYNFLVSSGQGMFPQEVVSRLGEIKNYKISSQSKLTELQITLDNYFNSINQDDRLKLETEYKNKLETYTKEHLRELESTTIAKVSIPSLNISTTGAVPGHPLNQFSMDEYQDNLRIATTTGQLWWIQSESVNDVYILDSRLQTVGSIKDLGVSERIYSARFIGDKGYLVTFKQIDPFYVLDLSNPRAPIKAGELKIPGFSSYLHPLSDKLVLGVGQEDGRVKLSLFDVSLANNPQEIAKYSLDEYWTEVSNNHHAFLQDDAHKVFFLPGGKGGYIFSYENNTLELKKAVSETNVKRAVYLNNYMYIVADRKIVVLNEANWSEVNSLSF